MRSKAEIIKLDHYGRGLFFEDGKINFVPFSLPGEKVEITLDKETKKYNIYSLDNIIIKSDKRVEPFCPYFTKCGGCHLQHLSYQDTLEFKLNKIREIINKFKIDCNNITIDKNDKIFNYRNKIELKCLNNKIGFYKYNSHELIDIKECMISNEAINGALKELKSINFANCDITIRSNFNNELLIWFKSQNKINITRDMFSDKLKIASIIINDDVIYGEDNLVMKVDKYYFKCSYDAFFQINPYVCESIYSYLKGIIKKDSIVVDLYCGVGFLSILAAESCKKVYGIEIVDNSVKNAVVNAKINKLDNMYFMLGDVAKIFGKINDKIDYLIVDPPRSGLDNKTLNMIINNNIPNIIYMSCDPMTLARDLKVLQEYYEIESIKCFDMFSWTYHVETICMLERKI